MDRAASALVKGFIVAAWKSPLRAVRELRRELLFSRSPNAVSGCFASFDEAARAAPRQAKLGYDSEAHAAMFDEWLGQLSIIDYPALFWLGQLLPNLERVFDLGGHKGLHYYGFRERIQLPASLTWRVCDLPTTVREGRLLAEQRAASQLEFTTEWQDGDGADLLLASGVLQYLDWDLAEKLRSFEVLPRHIILNTSPIYDGPSYVTLQNTQLSYNPYRVFNRQELIGSLLELGYREVDSWRNERSLSVPFHEELRVDGYRGYLLSRDPALSARFH